MTIAQSIATKRTAFVFPLFSLLLAFFPFLWLEKHQSSADRRGRERTRKENGKENGKTHSTTLTRSPPPPLLLRPLPLKKKKKLFFQKQQTVRDKCFAKCVTKPSTSLSSGEQTCLSRCCDRYSEATQVVLKSVLEQSGLS